MIISLGFACVVLYSKSTRISHSSVEFVKNAKCVFASSASCSTLSKIQRKQDIAESQDRTKKIESFIDTTQNVLNSKIIDIAPIPMKPEFKKRQSSYTKDFDEINDEIIHEQDNTPEIIHEQDNTPESETIEITAETVTEGLKHIGDKVYSKLPDKIKPKHEPEDGSKEVWIKYYKQQFAEDSDGLSKEYDELHQEYMKAVNTKNIETENKIKGKLDAVYDILMENNHG